MNVPKHIQDREGEVKKEWQKKEATSKKRKREDEANEEMKKKAREMLDKANVYDAKKEKRERKEVAAPGTASTSVKTKPPVVAKVKMTKACAAVTRAPSQAVPNAILGMNGFPAIANMPMGTSSFTGFAGPSGAGNPNVASGSGLAGQSELPVARTTTFPLPQRWNVRH